MEVASAYGSKAVLSVTKSVKTLWQTLRSLQNNPTCDLHRYVVSASDPAVGIAGTTTDALDCNRIPCLVTSYGEESEGLVVPLTQQKERRLVVYDHELTTRDVITYPSGSNQTWNITATKYDATTARCECDITPEAGDEY